MDPQWAVRLDRTVGRPVYRLHRLAYQLTGGRIGHRSPAGPILLLTTTGRRSGAPRTTPLLYMPLDGAWVVVASNGGRPSPPAWLLNLQADPRASVQVGRQRWPVEAEVLTGEERERLWPRLCAFYPGWAHYQTLTDRPIPAVVLRPR
ncbi:MAG TPA: nitroreductase family deazaflavin-dependent oxidoreductase [Acidimicrobiales bacterium]|nr:nitroreductase family deazaflavin-dependent oxidoreductase [Acidimicrobiales bacterium]